MKITHKQIRTPAFIKAIAKLANYGGFTDYKALANIKSILKQFEKLVEQTQMGWIAEIKKFAELDANGEFVPNEEVDEKTGEKTKREGTFKVPMEKRGDFHAAEALFDSLEVEIKADTLPFELVKNVGFSPNDLIHLEAIVAE